MTTLNAANATPLRTSAALLLRFTPNWGRLVLEVRGAPIRHATNGLAEPHRITWSTQSAGLVQFQASQLL